MEYIKSSISVDLAKKIIGSQASALVYLTQLNQISEIKGLKIKTISRGLNSGKKVLNLTAEEIWQTVVDTWDYEISKKVIRDLFRTTKKYHNGKAADRVMDTLIKEWKALNLGDISWPFSQGAFDEYVQRINALNDSGLVKDVKVKAAAVMYRRIKEINTVRNDFIETLIFEKNENILPTLNHRRGVDFFIEGTSFDQKVAKSPTNEFKRKYGEDWKQVAIEKPELVAEHLYQYQDEGRFGADHRLLVVYLDEDVSIDRIREIINKTDLNNPIEVSFTFNHKNLGEKNYQVPCFVILLRN